jgi:hypothetical protein
MARAAPLLLRNHTYLDARSDPALERLSIEQLRLRYKNGDRGIPVNAHLRSHRIFLSANEEVLSNTDTSIIKCVEAGYEAADYIPRDSRGGRGGQYYFGWMLVKVAEIVAL